MVDSGCGGQELLPSPTFLDLFVDFNEMVAFYAKCDTTARLSALRDIKRSG